MPIILEQRASTSHPPEAGILLVIGAVQFVNILDFMMVMPLGPDFGSALGIPNSEIGKIAGAYAFAASVAGVIGSAFLDRFDRRKALSVAMLGLVIGTLAGGFAIGLKTLMAARVLAGMFGGPATSLSLSVIADVIPPSRRGRAMTAVMGAFSIASVFGVPAGLWLAQRAGWRMPFFSVAALGAVVAASALFVMPSMRHHLTQVHQEPMSALLRDPAALLALAAVATVMMAAFAIIPSMSPFLQFNRGYPRDTLDRLYMVGGAVSFLAMWAIGRMIDRFGAPPVALGGTALFITVLWFGFVQQAPWPCLLIFIGFMLGMSFRNMPMTTLSTRVPMAHQRAGFMSAQSAVQHMSAAIGSTVSSALLKERPDRSLQGMDRVAFVAILLSLALPPLLVVIQRRVKIREARPG